jgi:hypothetical protein
MDPFDIPPAVQERRFRRAQKSKAKRKSRNRVAHAPIASKFSAYGEKSIGRNPAEYLDLQVPETLDLVSNLSETVDFIREFWRIVASRRARVRLVFEETKSIQPSALLLLLAYLHRARLIYGARHVTGTYPKSPRIENAMIDTGFLKLLGVKVRKARVAPRQPTLKLIPFMSNVVLDQDASRNLREALMGDEVRINIEAKKKLHRVISEAMLNVVQHAYPPQFHTDSAVRGRWWLAGKIDFSKDELLVMFCDLGIGIPKTLPKLYTWEKIREALSILPGINPSDGQMIQAAMAIGRSQTGSTNRGKGLNDLRRLVELHPNGELRIYSRAGLYVYRGNGTESVTNGNDKIGGTLIKWSVPLSSVTDWVPEPDSSEGVKNAEN